MMEQRRDSHGGCTGLRQTWQGLIARARARSRYMSIYSRLLTVGMSPPPCAAAATATPPAVGESPPVNFPPRSRMQPRGRTMPSVSRPSTSPPPRLTRGSVSFGPGRSANVPLNVGGGRGGEPGENWERTWVGGSSADIQKLGKQIRNNFKRSGSEGRNELKVSHMRCWFRC